MELAKHFSKQLFDSLHFTQSFVKRKEFYRRFVYSYVNLFKSQHSKAEKGGESDAPKKPKAVGPQQAALGPEAAGGISSSSSEDEDLVDSKRKRFELAWLPKVLEPAFQLCRWALPTSVVGVVSEDCSVLKVEGNGVGNQTPPTTRSVSEIIASIQRSKIGIEDWSLSDLTIGLFLIYLRQASVNPFEDVNGVQVSSDSMVQDLIYHSELAKGSYKDNTAALARNTMLRESNVLKFVKDSSVMRPGYYIGIDPCKKLVILGIRGTHTVYDLITDVVSSSDGEVTFEGRVIEKEDWRSVIDLVTNAKQVVSSVQDVARKLSDYAKFGSSKNSSGGPIIKKTPTALGVPLNDREVTDNTVAIKSGGAACKVPEELFVPGTVYYLKRNVDAHAGSNNGRRREYFMLWKRHPGSCPR
ncbi:hypothetical protein DVH24_028816 [Malus domestica]|uniref:Uncharacterized protein n=1 Tax=Malus domestica TaxID=3750 RepID=A0A498IVN8_MALDO|nr:hypothetical protein DVH24_028816 [Malus domestica]